MTLIYSPLNFTNDAMALERHATHTIAKPPPPPPNFIVLKSFWIAILSITNLAPTTTIRAKPSYLSLFKEDKHLCYTSLQLTKCLQVG